MRCPHCKTTCRYIGIQAGAEKYYGARMELWTCRACGTTLSKLVPLENAVDSTAIPLALAESMAEPSTQRQSGTAESRLR